MKFSSPNLLPKRFLNPVCENNEVMLTENHQTCVDICPRSETRPCCKNGTGSPTEYVVQLLAIP